MSMPASLLPPGSTPDPTLSLYHRLDPEVLANPYPLYDRLRTEDPVHWDPYLHAWLVTRYADVVTVLQRMSSTRMPTPKQLTALGLSELNPIAQVIVRQMIFMDPPSHTRLRALCAAAFTPSRAEALRNHIQEITDGLIDAVLPKGRMDEICDCFPTNRPDQASLIVVNSSVGLPHVPAAGIAALQFAALCPRRLRPRRRLSPPRVTYHAIRADRRVRR